MDNQYKTYNIFDQNNIRNYMQQQCIQHNNEQMLKVVKCVNKLHELMSAMDEVEPQYQKTAFEQCCVAIVTHYGNRFV